MQECHFEFTELNCLECKILCILYRYECKDKYNGLTITELLSSNEKTLGTRMTIYKKMKKLVNAGYIAKGILDNHADTFYLTEKGIEIVKMFG